VARIFIVEDDQDLNAAYRMILSKEGHEVDSAFNGDEALEKVSEFDPDLILLDLLMPVKSGVEFLQEYDVVNKHNTVKVLIFTNLEHASEIHEAFRLGANQCVIKAWTAPQGLVKIVNDVLESKSDERRQSSARDIEKHTEKPSLKPAM
jgi:two-component system response regulator VicR